MSAQVNRLARFLHSTLLFSILLLLKWFEIHVYWNKNLMYSKVTSRIKIMMQLYDRMENRV
jgi:hypothetical protein